ncbi:MAG: hypothetical protein WCV85_02635 [Patescibacteria group bacterium]|jgi:hypothetical protein
MKKKTFAIIFWVVAACVLTCAAYLDFTDYAEREDAEKRVQVFPDSIIFVGSSSTTGEDSLFLKLPVRYNLADSSGAFLKCSHVLACWLADHRFKARVAMRYSECDTYRADDSNTIVVAEYYLVEKK